jgi:hypothetical protein
MSAGGPSPFRVPVSRDEVGLRMLSPSLLGWGTGPEEEGINCAAPLGL